ncbi:MAG: hypothetical protein ABFS12_09940 [Bacteroidota bacterium]
MKTKFLLLLFLFATSFIPITGQIGVGAKAGVYLPVAELAKSYNTGYGGEAAFIYRFNPDFEVSLVGGMSFYNADEEELKQRLHEKYSEIIGEVNIDAEINVEAPLNVYPLMFNIKYLFGKKKFKPYFFFEGGIFFYDLTYKGSIKIINGPEVDLPEPIEKRSSTTLALGGGFLSSLTKKLFLNVKAKWGIMNNIRLVEEDTNEEIPGVDKTAQTISLSAGLNYYF